MLEHNNPAIDYESLSQKVAAASSSDETPERGCYESIRQALLLSECEARLNSAQKAHRVVSPLPSFLNPILRDQAAVNKALFKTLETLLTSLQIQEELNTSLLKEMDALKKSRAK